MQGKKEIIGKRRLKGKRQILLSCIVFAVLLTAIGFLGYPALKDVLVKYQDRQITKQYQQTAGRENRQEMQQTRARLAEENQRLAKSGLHIGKDPFKKDGTGDFDMSPDYIGSHTIGIVTIPKIKVSLPIFEIANEFFLNRGASLLGGTSFPVGGTGSRAVISAYRGGTAARFFTDLPKMKSGDKFYLDCYGKKLAYEVEKIQTVKPESTKALAVRKDRDLVTLMTAPARAGASRLLVTGHRVSYAVKEDNAVIVAAAKSGIFWAVVRVVLLLLLTAAVSLLFAYRIRTLLIKGRSYALTFMVGIGAVGSYKFYTHGGRRPLLHHGREMTVPVNERHMLHVDHLRGGTYWLKGDNPGLKDRMIFVKRLKDSYFTWKR